MVMPCIANGDVMPSFASEVVMAGSTPSASKVSGSVTLESLPSWAVFSRIPAEAGELDELCILDFVYERVLGGPMGKLAIGDVAPEFTLQDQDEVPVSLSSHKGRRVVIYFYPKDDTPGCTKEACQFNDLLAQFAGVDADVFGISRDGAASHQRFRAKYGLTFALLSDPEHSAMEAYGAWGEKMNYGKTSMGVIRSTFLVGPDGKIEQAWYNVKADGHAEKVLAALAA